MMGELLRVLFSLDHPFIELRLTGLAPERREAVAAFWSEPAVADMAAELRLVPDDLDALTTTIVELAGEGRVGEQRAPWKYSYESWLEVARRSEAMRARDPMAASLIALEALAGWAGALGKNLFVQPFTGHHPGWHVFPLTLAGSLAEADAIWGARHIVALASGFIEAAHAAFADESIQSALAEYQAVSERIERRYAECVADLAWDLRAACTTSEPNFRAEIAAMFWVSGDVPHADLLAAGGAGSYVPSAAVLRTLVDHSLRRVAHSPLQQYVWLEMKDRPPVDLRAHKVLFSFINNVFGENASHAIEAWGISSPSRAVARAAIGHFRGSIGSDERDELREAFALHGEFLRLQAPVAYVCIASLVNLVLIDEPEVQSGNWRALALVAAEVLRGASRFGYFELLDRSLDIPFHYLPLEGAVDLRATLDVVEQYRCGNLWYWLTITPPPPPGARRAQHLLAEEQELLGELRGARFIRLLPRLPRHYGRYGFSMDDALDLPAPEGGAAPRSPSLLNFDPFDQELAVQQLRGVLERLTEVHRKLQRVAPKYGDSRLDPCVSIDQFVDALGSTRHRGPAAATSARRR